MENTNLFNCGVQNAGFRLEYAEIYNWGVFDGEIQTIRLDGKDCMLAGKNGSGKSTAVDALTTLLVRKGKRAYNQAAGESKKTDRSIATYVRGRFGVRSNDSGIIGENASNDGFFNQDLRPGNTYSVLLAVFKEPSGKTISLFQVHSMVEGNMSVDSLYGYASVALTIDGDFGDYVSGKGQRGWMSSFEKKHCNGGRKTVSFCENAKDYYDVIWQLFNMQSVGGLNLFGQIVGIKSLDNADAFIRDLILDDKEPEKEYQEFIRIYDELNSARVKVNMAEEQLLRLNPIAEQYGLWKENQSKLDNVEALRKSLKAVFADKRLQLWQAECKAREDEMIKCEAAAANTAEALSKTRQLKDDLLQSMQGNPVLQKIEALKYRLSDKKKDLDNCQKEEQEYYLETKALFGFGGEVGDADGFDSIKSAAEEKACQMNKEADNLRIELFQAEQKYGELQNKKKELVDELFILQKSKGNLPQDQQRIREKLAAELGVGTDVLPYVGELLKVRDEDRRWMPAVEKLLRDFALTMIVPEDFVGAVVEFADKQGLGAKFVFQSFSDDPFCSIVDDVPLAADSVAAKVEVKAGTAYSDWLRQRLNAEFSHICVGSAADGVVEKKAVAASGLASDGVGCFMKDDSRAYDTVLDCVLGWDNAEKKEELNKMLDALRGEISKLEIGMESAKAAASKKQAAAERLSKFCVRFRSFEDIDVGSIAKQIAGIEADIKTLEDSSADIRAAQQRINQLEAEIKSLDGEKDAANQKIGTLQGELKDLVSRRRAIEDEAKSFGEGDRALALSEKPEVWDCCWRDIDEKEKSELARCASAILQAAKTIEAAKGDIARLCAEYRHGPKDQMGNAVYPLWAGETRGVPEIIRELEDLEPYMEKRQEIEESALPEFKKDFDELFHDNAADNARRFREFFRRWERTISEVVENMNESLKDVRFNDELGTYVQLKSNLDLKSNGPAQRFRSMLDDVVPNAQSSGSAEGLRQHFEGHIVPFIEALSDEQFRREAMDVRKWYKFGIREYFIDGGAEFKVYSSTGAMSGGEKPQLTYTIIVAAAAMLFGINKAGDNPTFRFIAVDETFKNQDNVRSEYFLRLCRQMNIQLLVVAPIDFGGWDVVKNYASSVAEVVKEGNTATIYNIRMTDFADGEVESENSMEL